MKKGNNLGLSLAALIVSIAVVVLTLAFPNGARSQVATLIVDSPWTAFGSEVKHSFAAVPLQLNSVGNLVAISGQRMAIGQLKFQQSSVSVTFKGPALSSTTGFKVVGLRAYHEMSALSMSMPEHPVNWLFHEPLLVPPGQKMTCRYDMPLIGFGALTCAIGTVVPAPVPPAPPPPVSVVANKMPPAGFLIDAQGATWTLKTQVIAGENAFACLRAGIKADHCSAMCRSTDGFIYGQDNINGGGQWQRWLNPGWSPHGPTPAGC